MHVLLTGAIEVEEAMALVAARLGRTVGDEPGASPVRALPAPVGVRLVAVDVPEATQARVALRLAAPSLAQADATAMRALNDALAGSGTNDRLNRRTREELGASYGVGATWINRPDIASWTLSTAVGTDAASLVLVAIDEVLLM